MRRRRRYAVIIIAILVAGGLIARARWRGPQIKTGSYLLLNIGGAYAEAPPQDLLVQVLRGSQQTLIDLLAMIRTAQHDDRIQGVIAQVTGLDVGWAKVQDIRDALLEFKRSGKPLLALLEQEVSGSNREYYLATAADRIYLSPCVSAPLKGLSSEAVFLGGVWDKLDIEMHVEKVREYKTFGDMLVNKQMTPAHREMVNSLLDSLDAQFVAGIAQARDMDAAQVHALVDQCPVTPDAFEAAHLSDGTKYVQDLHDALGGEQTPLVRMDDYVHVDGRSFHLGVGPKIAVVHAVGAIITGESGTGLQGEMAGADTVEAALRDAAADDATKAIVLRIDSPGGSALASDLIWRATQAAGKKKPVIASMSDVAASGGYYVAAGAQHIVAQPGSLTGSIGVVLARPNVHRLLERVGITTETVTRGRLADLDNLTTPLTPEGREKLVAGIEYTYHIFVDRVSTGRHMTPEQVDAVGRGRVWTGAQAKEKGLVDELGGWRTALAAAKKAAGLDPDAEVQLVFYPRPKGVLQRLAEVLGTHAAVEVPREWRHIFSAVASPFAEGTVLTSMRERIEIR